MYFHSVRDISGIFTRFQNFYMKQTTLTEYNTYLVDLLQ